MKGIKRRKKGGRKKMKKRVNLCKYYTVMKGILKFF
jgi:hypothetical protein